MIVYNSRGKILLGKRREGEIGGGKWAILGGSGAFGESENREDFAQRELRYDLVINFRREALKLFTTVILGNTAIEDYFIYKEDDKIKVSGKEKAPTEIRWFSAEQINQLAKRGEIAFENYKTLRLFEKQVLKGQVIR